LITSWVEGVVPEGNPEDLPQKPKIAQPPKPTTKRNQIIVTGEHTLRSSLRLAGLIPHKVPPGLSMRVQARLPDGTRVPLVWLYEYKEQYKHTFLLRTVLTLPAGTVIQGVPAGASIILLPA
jgi:hypothetical protein